jgi:formylglycine-generating enzyme required for sulfatase activity
MTGATSTCRLLALAAALALAPAAARAEDPPPNMVLVAEGEFTMGTDRGENPDPNQPRVLADARPSRRVSLKAFWIDKTEVTNAQYKLFCDATSYPPPPDWEGGKIPTGQEENPVTRVSWFEARAYAEWVGKRLPSEAEWEKAARGTDGREFPWGGDFDRSRVVYEAAGAGKVGQLPAGASPSGALDMAGNAWEWTEDWYAGYPNAPFQFPEYGEKYKVARGGGWAASFDHVMRTYYRSVAPPAARSEFIGFRCARDAR